MKIKLFFLLLYEILLISCVPQMIKNEFTFCYDGNYTEIDKILNINGFYSYYEIKDSYLKISEHGGNDLYIHKIDTINVNYMFSKDGIFFSEAFFDTSTTNNSDLSKHSPGQLNSHNNEILSRQLYDKDSIVVSYFKGCYILCGDTIKAQYINHPDPLAPTWMGFEKWFKIVDKNTIKAIAFRKLYYDKENEAKSKPEMDLRILDEKDTYIASFVSLDILPSSYCWLKKKKWFWCDKQAWKAYKKTKKKRL